jgi:hypothetical protein
VKHYDYVESLSQRDSGFEPRLKAARAVLDFGVWVHECMTTARFAPEDVARVTGLASERIAEIVEGETPALDEVIALCAALDMQLSIDSHFGLHPARVPGSAVATSFGSSH